MENERFDEIARSLGSGASRRKVLAGLVGAALGLIGGRSASAQEAPVFACGSAVCAYDEYCCNESCGICAPLGGFCTLQLCGSGFREGDIMVTTTVLNYRSQPTLNGGIIMVLAEGTQGAIYEGPYAADGYNWYSLGLPGFGPDGQAPGWVAGEYLTLV